MNLVKKLEREVKILDAVHEKAVKLGFKDWWDWLAAEHKKNPKKKKQAHKAYKYLLKVEKKIK